MSGAVSLGVYNGLSGSAFSVVSVVFAVSVLSTAKAGTAEKISRMNNVKMEIAFLYFFKTYHPTSPVKTFGGLQITTPIATINMSLLAYEPKSTIPFEDSAASLFSHCRPIV